MSGISHPVIRHFRVHWRGPVLSSFSIAEASRNYLLALHELGCNLSVTQTIEMQNRGWLSPELESFFQKLIRKRVRPPYYHVNYSVTMVFRVDDAALANVGYMPVDNSELNPDWTRGWEGQDELWVPCLFNVAGMIRAGFDPGRVWRVPHGVEVERFRPGLEPLAA